MVTAGIWLVYAGVALRALVRFAGLPECGLVVLLLALYGLLLLAEPWLVAQPLGPLPETSGNPGRRRGWLPAGYLLVQTGLVVGLFSIPPHVDFFAGLFVPLSLQAVLFFGRRLGFLCIAIFPLAMFGGLAANARGWLFALAMSAFLGCICFLFGGYAHQVQKAETVRRRNQRLLDELQAANHQLQSYAAQVEDLAAERERSRLARELHDSVTQTVFSMNLTVQSARLLLAKDSGLAEAQLRRLEELAACAMDEIQALASQLRPVPPAREGLAAALRDLAAERQGRDGLRVAVTVNGERALPEAVAAGLYRIAQEALANVAKHSGTLEATLRLNLAGDLASLEIEDRGLGFDTGTILDPREHLGLPGMAERAREIGWNLAIDSRPGHGTRIRVGEHPPGAVA